MDRLLADGPLLCLVTDSAASRLPLEEAVALAVYGGVTLVQVRDKLLSGRELLALAQRIIERVEGRARIVVNQRVDIAYASAADGVHLPSNGIAPAAAREMLGNSAIIGQSIHVVADIKRCAGSPIDYFELGTIFESRTHPGGPTQGLEPLRAAARTSTPIIAIGGISAETAGAVLEAGAAGVAVISAILGDSDPRNAAARIRDAMARAWPARATSDFPHEVAPT